MADDYTKGIPISLKINEKDIEEFKSILKQIEDGQETDINRLKEILKASKSSEKKENKEKKAQEEEQGYSFKDFAGKALGMDFNTSFKVQFLEGLAGVLNNALKKLESILGDSWDELDTMLNYSRLSNKEVREQAFEFGFSPEQNYAYTKAMGIMGLSDFEDLYFLTESQWERFNKNFENYSDKYSRLYDDGFFDTLEDYNYTMAEFEEEIKMGFVEMFINNKDVIITGFKALMTITDAVLSLLRFFTGGKKSERQLNAEINEEIARIRGSQNVTNKNQNVTFSPTFNGVGTDVQKQLNTSLTLVKEQIIAALE